MLPTGRAVPHSRGMNFVSPVLLLALSGCAWITDAEHQDFVDADEDGYYSDFFSDGDDCDDADDTVHPGAPELCDGIDNDCDGAAEIGDDCLDTPGDHDTVDDDGDGYSEAEGDCDDGNGAINPAATDIVGDGVDQNCDGVDGVDGDEDGYAAEWSGGDDCDDADPSTYPGAAELESATICMTDADEDGWGSPASGGTDCNDEDQAINPGASESWYDGIDQDCDGASDFDSDQDGHDSDEWGGEDCDDSDDTVFPGADETISDGVDQDCDGSDLEPYSAVSAGGAHACALGPSGGIECWGNDYSGVVSDAPSGSGYTAVSAGTRGCCALDSWGGIECWGDDGYDVVTDVPTGAGYTSLSVGGEHACALESSGGIVCWGRDSDGQVSDAP